ncbi:MAG: hypothetical protein J6W06_05030 [Bacteroidales bacterium]|nr:hypothetical protein [Bacteroidales bacterium]
MDFYFVYSSGGGAGDWNGVDRMFKHYMPDYLKDHILIKFGDIFFNHRSQNSIIKPRLWREINNARKWIVDNTNDSMLYKTPNLIMDVGTTKIVSYLTANNQAKSVKELVDGFDNILFKESVLEKYCNLITESQIKYAVTFDIPNLFKVRSQIGDISRNVYSGTSNLLIDASARYANEIFNGVKNESLLLTTINGSWSINDIEKFMSKLKYSPSKLGIGGLSDLRNPNEFSLLIKNLDKHLDFSKFERVHFLGCGGLKKANAIKEAIGNQHNFSVDNTTPYNRSIDGNKKGTEQSCYYDYATKEKIRISSDTKQRILSLHKASESVSCFDTKEMTKIIDSIILHQSHQSSQETYDARGKLIIHNFDVFRYNAE